MSLQNSANSKGQFAEKIRQIVFHVRQIGCRQNVFRQIVRNHLGAAYVTILLSEVEQEQRPSGTGDREAILVGAGFCDGEGERAYTIYDTILDGEKYLKYFLNAKL